MKSELMPLGQYYELPERLVGEMRSRGPNHEDLRLARVEWKKGEEEKFSFLPTDHVRLRQRYASLYLISAEDATPEVEKELFDWALDELYDARDSATQMLDNAKEDIVAKTKLILLEIESQITEVEARRALVSKS